MIARELKTLLDEFIDRRMRDHEDHDKIQSVQWAMHALLILLLEKEQRSDPD